MISYIGRRLFHAALTLFAVASLLFIMFRMMPGDPMAQVLSPALDEAVQARLRAAFGLDLPLWQQYLIYLRNLVTLDWGRSFRTSEPVFDVLAYRFVNTALLMSLGLALAITIGTVLGMVMACFRNSAFDVASTTMALVWQAAPPFTTGIALLMLLSYRLDLFPSGGMISPGANAASLSDIVFSPDFLHHLILPTICITGYYIATPMLIMRDSMLDVLNSDYVEFARAKGLSPLRVILAHAARNALMSLVTVCGVLLGFAIGGQVVVETVFSWPGMGRAMVEAASAQDYPVAQGAFLLLATVIVVANLLADISYGFLDPRIRTGGAAR